MGNQSTEKLYSNIPALTNEPILTESGSEIKTFNLRKRVAPSNLINSAFNTNFKTLEKSPTPLNEERIKEIYMIYFMI